MFKLNVVDFLAEGLRHAWQGRTITGAQEQVWLDGLPAPAIDSHGY